MERPQALWAALLALLPWLALLRVPRARAPRVVFPALFLISSPRQRRRRSLKRVLRAATRSLAIVSLALLWANPTPRDDAPTGVENGAERIEPNAESGAKLRNVLVVDGSDSGALRDGATSAQIILLALDAQLDDVEVGRVPSLEFAARPVGALEERDVAILVDVAALSPREENAVAERASQADRGVVVWAGANTDATRWNETLRRWNVDARIVDAPLRSAPASTSTREERAFLDAFPGGASAAIDAPPCDRVLTVVGADSTAILRDRQSGAAIFSRLKNGLYWFGISPDPSFGALVATPTFPALAEAVAQTSLRRFDAARASSRARVARKKTIDFALWTIVLIATFAEFLTPRAAKRRRAPR